MAQMARIGSVRRSRVDSWVFGALAILGLLCASGCVVVPKLRAPELTVVGVDSLGGSLRATRLAVRVHASNPNDRDIAVRAVECDLEVAGTHVAHGTTDAGFVLPRLGGTDFSVTVVADLGGAVPLALAHLQHNALDYRLYGRVHLASGVVRFFPFDQRGSLKP